MSQIQAFYNASPTTEWRREERHRTEFAVTHRALAEFLSPPSARVFDVGGGPGRYAIELARRGYGSRCWIWRGGIWTGHGEAMNKLSGEEWARWVEINYRVSREPSLLGGADHLLYVGRA